MAVKEDKFIVFPKKDLVGISAAQVATLNKIDQLVQMNRIKRGASQFPKFIICNQDEPYSDKVWQIILDGESAKEHAATMDRIIKRTPRMTCAGKEEAR